MGHFKCVFSQQKVSDVLSLPTQREVVETENCHKNQGIFPTEKKFPVQTCVAFHHVHVTPGVV